MIPYFHFDSTDFEKPKPQESTRDTRQFDEEQQFEVEDEICTSGYSSGKEQLS